MIRVLVASLCTLVLACGEDPAPNHDLLDKLRALPGVTVDEAITTTPGYTFYVLWFTQPVDHDNPGDGLTFEQRVSLLHRDLEAPMVAMTTGYWDYARDKPYELAQVIQGNQISIEHRFFGESRPEPADWTKLTIKQMADDEHEIIAALRTVYLGPFVTSGGSKGGMTAIYHRRFYPDDVDATVPYVAPISFGAPDPRYAPYLDTIGPAACRQAVRDFATELLANRRDAMLARAQDQATKQSYAYTRVAIGPAVESSIQSFEWSYWQYYGTNHCSALPPTNATDNEMWDFLDYIVPVSDSSDSQIELFEAYYHQAYAQLGFPAIGADYLDQYLMYSDADYARALPAGMPAYDDAAAMRDIDSFVKQSGNRLLFIYGQWDPWTGGPFELGSATDSLKLTVAQGTHSARLARLSEADRTAAFAKIAAWTGVTPALPQARVAPGSSSRTLDGELQAEAEPRVPPPMLRALRSRR